MNETKFVWHELTTVDPMAAKRFYPELFGWTARDQDMGPHGVYTLWMNGERGVGGMMAVDKGHGIPSQWIGYVKVPDVDLAAGKATKLGGKLMVPPSDIPEVGRFAMMHDPQGAAVAVMKVAGPDMPWEAPRVHEWCWDELNTTDPKGAMAFYGEVVGWKFHTEEMGNYGSYTLLMWGDEHQGGMQKARDGVPAWVFHVSVDDVDVWAKKVTTLGGKVLVPPMDTPFGRFAKVSDPTGAMFALWKSFPRNK